MNYFEKKLKKKFEEKEDCEIVKNEEGKYKILKNKKHVLKNAEICNIFLDSDDNTDNSDDSD